MDDRPDRRAQGDAHRVRDRVADPERHDVERPDVELVAGVERHERVVVELVLLDLVAEEAAGQGAGVDRHARELREHVGQGADVVLVGVGDEERLDLGAVLLEVGDVGDDEVDAEHLLVREHESAVDDDDVVAVLEDVHVLADLPHPAERDDAEWQIWRWRLCFGPSWVGMRVLGWVVQNRVSWSVSAVSRGVVREHGGWRRRRCRRVIGVRRDRPSRSRLGVGDGRGSATVSSRRLRDAIRAPGRPGDVIEALALDRGRPQRGRGVVHGEHERVARAGLGIGRPDRPVDLRDPGAGQEARHREAAERDDDRRIQDLELTASGTASRRRSRRASDRGCPVAGTSRRS